MQNCHQLIKNETKKKIDLSGLKLILCEPSSQFSPIQRPQKRSRPAIKETDSTDAVDLHH